MSIPDYQSLLLPLLGFAADGKEHSLREAVDLLAQRFDLTPDERRELLPSGQQEVFNNRVAWASTYLRKAVLLESTRRGYFRITARGVSVLGESPTTLDARYLERFSEFREFRSRKVKKETQEVPETPVCEDTTPQEALEDAYQRLREDLAAEILQQVKTASARLFEKLVVELLVKMGYGGSRRDAGKAVGGTGDEGIDGIIKEDHLGLDNIYIQAKRWENNVGRPEVQKFAGALQGQRARKGVMITTSSFSGEALDFVSHIESRIILIDGKQLAQYMIDFNLGVGLVAAYEVKKVDSDYFLDE